MFLKITPVYLLNWCLFSDLCDLRKEGAWPKTRHKHMPIALMARHINCSSNYYSTVTLKA